MGTSEIILNFCAIAITIGFIFYVLEDFFLYKIHESNAKYIEELNLALQEINDQIRLDIDQVIQKKFEVIVETIDTKMQEIQSVDKTKQL